MNDKVIEYDFGIFKAYFNEENSKSIFIPNDLIKDKEQIFMVNDFFASCSLPKAGISKKPLLFDLLFEKYVK